MKVGFIGLGRMGQGMALRVLGAGHDVKGYNRTPEKAAEIGAAGATIVPTIADAVSDREVVITMLGTQLAWGLGLLLVGRILWLQWTGGGPSAKG